MYFQHAASLWVASQALWIKITDTFLKSIKESHIGPGAAKERFWSGPRVTLTQHWSGPGATHIRLTVTRKLPVNFNGRIDVQLSPYGLLLLTQPIQSSEQLIRANLEFSSNFDTTLELLQG